MNDDNVILTRQEYDELMDRITDMEDDLQLLSALQAAGVDNWDGYDYAISLYEGEE